MFQWVQGALTARTTGARGSVMTPVQWVIAMLAAGLTGASYRGSHDWVLVFFAVLLGGGIIFFAVVYCRWMKIDPDALRSEWYSLRKREIDQGYIGDDKAGMRKVSRRVPPVQVAEPAPKESS